MSLLLVFAMVLAMVPAVFAADAKKAQQLNGGTKYLAPYQTLFIKWSEETEAKKSSLTNGQQYATTITKWENKGLSLIDMAVAEDKQSVTLTHLGGSGSAAITAYYQYTDSKGATQETVAATWTVTVTPWDMKLSPSGTTSSKPYSLTANDSVTLTATVTGVNEWLKEADTKVRFTSASSMIAKVENKGSYSQGLRVTNNGANTSTATAAVTVSAGTGNGTVKITAELGKETSSNGWTAYTDTKGNPITQEFWVSVGGSAEYEIKFSNDELSSDIEANRVMTVSYNTTSKKITPVLYRNGTKVTSNKIEFTYSSSNPRLVYINPDGTVLLQDPNRNQTGESTITVGVKLNGNELTGTVARCTVKVIKKAADGVSIDYSNLETKLAMQNGKYVFGYKDNDSSNASVTFSNGDKIVTALNLSATVDSEDKTNDLTRVKWTTESPKVAKFRNSSGSLVNEIYGGDVTLVSTGTGSVRVTAELDGKTAAMTFTVWPAYEYNEIVTKPDIPTSISSREDAFNRFSEQYVTIRLTRTGNTVSRLMRNVQYTSSSNIQLEGWVDGFDTANKIAYYPRTVDTGSGSGTSTRGLDYILSSETTLSDIIILNQPQDASYKLDATVGTLSIQATPRNGKQMTSFTWYDNNDKAIKVETVNHLTSTYTSTLKLSDFITSAGTYGFYCIVRGSGNSSVKSRTAIISIGGDYNVKITANSSSIKPGDRVTLNAVAQQYNPVTKGYTDVTGASYTVNWAITDGDTTAATLSSRTGSSVTLTAKSGGTFTVTAETTIGSNKYTGTQKITITVPTANDVSILLGENETSVTLDGTKISDAVKAAAKSAPTYISFTQPASGTIYTNSTMSSKVTDGNKYTPADVSKMVFKPTTNAASYTLEYKAYGADGQIASGKVIVMTNAGSVVYHISANESQQMLVSDFQTKYGSGLSTIVFGTNSDSRGGLYKGSTTSSGKVGSESYTTTTLKNVYFIAGSTASKYTVTIPYTANGSNGTKYGNLIVYVNDTHSIYSTGASFRSMSIADEIAPDNASSNAYITIDSVTGGKLYSAYSSIISNTPLKSSDLGSTKYYFNSSSTGIDSLYVLPVAGKTAVEVNYTVYDGSTRTKGSVSFKVIQQATSTKFSDVNGSTKWAANSVDFMADSKLVNGMTTTTFGPNQTMTRAMLVTILYRAAGQPSVAGITNKFTDLKANEYYVDAVLWASSTGVVTGTAATKFDPDGKVTREQIAAILYRYAGSPTGNASSLAGFSDQKNVSAYAVPALQWAVGLGIITGVSTNGRTTLSAKNNATRAQVAVMLHRFLTFDH